VHLKETTLSSGLRLGLGSVQAIRRHGLPREEYRSRMQEALPMCLSRKFGAGPKPPEPQVPELLPYMCNRVDQELQLAEAADRRKAEAPEYPLVCIVHGDEDQCHWEFLGRLRERTLPRVLSLDPRREPVKEYLVHCPSNARTIADFRRRFHVALGDRVLS